MKKVSLVMHKNYVEDIIKKLHETGVMQIIDISKNETDITDVLPGEANPEAETCANYELRISRLIDILDKIKVKKSGIKSLLDPELPEIKIVEDNALDDIYSHAEGMLHEIEKTILEKEQKLQEFTEKIDAMSQLIKDLEYFTDFDLKIEHLGESEHIFAKIGITTDLEFLKEKTSEIDLIDLKFKQFGTGKKIKWAVLIVGHISEKEKIERITRETISEFNLEGHTGSPNDLIKILKKELKIIKKEKKQIRKLLQKYSKENLSDLLALREEINIERVRFLLSKNFVKTNSTFIIKGWVVEKDIDLLEDSLKSVSNNHVICDFETPSENPDDPPTFIDTPRWAEGFKGLLSMFSLPRYNEINPTIIMGIFFVLFFGFMLGDAGYGLVILFLSLFGYFKLGKHSDMIGSWSFMGIWMGLITTIVGFLTNSFFGDFIPRFFYGDPTKPLYSLDVMGVHLPANAIKDPLTILTIALILGLVHLNVGILLGIYQSFRQKKYKEMITARFCWIPLQLGGGMLIGYFILDFSLSEPLFMISGILVVIGIIQLFLSAGPIGFFDITGYVGDWLSYARLLALGLATAGMALAFNVVSELLKEMIPIQIIGVTIMIILLIIMHIVNLGLQALGAGVHSLRLQYVEFFNRFYEGGGTEFSPFKIEREYTKKDEKIE